MTDQDIIVKVIYEELRRQHEEGGNNSPYVVSRSDFHGEVLVDGDVDLVAVAAALRERYAIVERLEIGTPESHRWVDAEGNPDWDAHADAVRQALLDRLCDQYWIVIAGNGLIHYGTDGTGDTPAQSREFAAALLAAADAVEADQ